MIGCLMMMVMMRAFPLLPQGFLYLIQFIFTKSLGLSVFFQVVLWLKLL